jgi:hypothetical protein
LRQQEQGGYGKQESGRGYSGTKSACALTRETQGKDNERREYDHGFGRRELEKLEIGHG